MPSRRAPRSTDFVVGPFKGQFSLSCRYTVVRSIYCLIVAALKRSRILGRLVRSGEAVLTDPG